MRKLMAVITKPSRYKSTDLKRIEKKKRKGWKQACQSLALLKVRVAYLQCGQSSP